MELIRNIILFAAGVPGEDAEHHTAVARRGLYVIGAAVWIVAFCVAFGAAMLSFRYLPNTSYKWPTIILLAIGAGIIIFTIDLSLIVAGTGVTSKLGQALLFLVRIGFVCIFSMNFSHELILWQHEASLNQIRLRLEMETMTHDQNTLKNLHGVTQWEQTKGEVEKRLKELRKQYQVLPPIILKQVSAATASQSAAYRLWQDWHILNQAGKEDEALHKRAEQKSIEARRLRNTAESAKNDYLKRVGKEITVESTNLQNAQTNLVTAQESSGKAWESRRDSISSNFSSRQMNRAALDQLRKENPSINREIWEKTLFFGFIELLPILLKILIGSNNPVYEDLRCQQVSGTLQQRSKLRFAQARDVAEQIAYKGNEVQGAFNGDAIIRIDSRIPLSAYADLVTDSMDAILRAQERPAPENVRYMWNEHLFGAIRNSFNRAAERQTAKTA